MRTIIGSIAAAIATLAPAAPSKPNTVLIFSDDYGIGGVGCCGSDRYKTPNIDALARTGLRFESCFAMPLCAPSRGVAMTGRYPFRTGRTGGSGDSMSS